MDRKSSFVAFQDWLTLTAWDGTERDIQKSPVRLPVERPHLEPRSVVSDCLPASLEQSAA